MGTTEDGQNHSRNCIRTAGYKIIVIPTKIEAWPKTGIIILITRKIVVRVFDFRRFTWIYIYNKTSVCEYYVYYKCISVRGLWTEKKSSEDFEIFVRTARPRRHINRISPPNKESYTKYNITVYWHWGTVG